MKLEDVSLLKKLGTGTVLALLSMSVTGWWVHRATRSDLALGTASVMQCE